MIEEEFLNELYRDLYDRWEPIYMDDGSEELLPVADEVPS